VGGAAIVVDAREISMPEARRELAMLWDIRVAPEGRGNGIGSALVVAAQTWAAARGCRQLAVETQNVNVPACMFYLHHGFELGSIQRFAYPALPEEVKLLWYKALGATR
jgi:GNAT superfamily N-acetyltransferase